MRKAWKTIFLTAISCLTLGTVSLFGACGDVGDKEIYYETQVRFYVSPEAPPSDFSGSDYEVGLYSEQEMQDMIDGLNGDFLTMVCQSFSVGQFEDVGEIYEQVAESLEYYSVSSSDGQFARSFIYADIFVPEEAGRDFADNLYEAVINMTSEYVEANMAIPQGYTGTNCQRISRNDEIKKVKK